MARLQWNLPIDHFVCLPYRRVLLLATVATVAPIAAAIFPVAITIADRYRPASYVTITNAISLFDSPWRFLHPPPPFPFEIYPGSTRQTGK